MAQPRIFISYRRDDAAGYARALGDELARNFGADRVFMDVDDIDAGQTFADAIRRAVGESTVLLVLIGERWLGARDGRPARIGEPGDFVRMEVAAGLARGMRVIPLLLDGASMPQASELPDDVRALAGRNALELDNSRFAADTARLIAAVRASVGVNSPPSGLPVMRPAPGSRRRWMLAAAAVVVTVGGASVWAWHGWLSASPMAGTAASAPVDVRAKVDGAWLAVIEYDWPNARFDERFVFTTDGSNLAGSASFLGVPRGVLEGVAEADGLRFVTRTSESDGHVAVHRYRGRLVGDELRFVMQTEGGISPHVPVVFVARRSPSTAPASSR